MTVWINKAHLGGDCPASSRNFASHYWRSGLFFVGFFRANFRFGLFFSTRFVRSMLSCPMGAEFLKTCLMFKVPKVSSSPVLFLFSHDSWLRVFEQQVHRLLAEVLVACYLARKRQHGVMVRPKYPGNFTVSIARIPALKFTNHPQLASWSMLLHTYHISEYMTWQELILKIYIKKESLLHISFFSSQSPIWSAMHIALDVDVSYYYLYFCTKLFIWKCSTRHALTNSASTLPFEKVSLTAPRKDVISQLCLLLKTLKQVFSTTKKKTSSKSSICIWSTASCFHFLQQILNILLFPSSRLSKIKTRRQRWIQWTGGTPKSLLKVAARWY